MRCLHLSDLHLGKRLIEVSLLEDQQYILDQIVTIAEEKRLKAVLIAGDVYDRSNPAAEAMTLFGQFVRKLTGLGCKVLVISGNHDSPERVAYFGELLQESGVYLSPVYDGHIEPVPLEDEYGEVRFYLVPYAHPEVMRGLFPEETVADANDAARLVLGGLSLDTSCRNVILSHQLILGSSFDEREQRAVGTLDNVDPRLYDAFDYVALGHIHKSQSVGREDGTMRYCGTPMKYSKKEVGTDKTVTLVELGEKGHVTWEEIPLRPKREMRLERGSFDTLIAKGPDAGCEDDYFFITLTDEEDIPNAAARLRNRFGKVLAVDFDNARTRAGENIELGSVDAEEKTPRELIEALYKIMRNRDMSSEAKAFVQRAMQETEGFEE